MSSGAGITVGLTIIFLPDVDPQRAYEVADTISKQKDREIAFNGMFSINISGTPLISESLLFTLNLADVNSVIDEVTSKLGLVRNEIRYQINPATHPVERPPPKGMIG